MKQKTYSEKLQDPRWQKKRLEILERDNFTCQYCFDNTSMLSVHHLFYNNKDPWESESCDLVTLCQKCHETEKDRPKYEKKLLDILKRKNYTISEIESLCEMFSSISSITPDIEVNSIKYAINNLDIVNNYFKHLKGKTNEEN
jgi:hypothetical protein